MGECVDEVARHEAREARVIAERAQEAGRQAWSAFGRVQRDIQGLRASVDEGFAKMESDMRSSVEQAIENTVPELAEEIARETAEPIARETAREQAVITARHFVLPERDHEREREERDEREREREREREAADRARAKASSSAPPGAWDKGLERFTGRWMIRFVGAIALVLATLLIERAILGPSAPGVEHVNRALEHAAP